MTLIKYDHLHVKGTITGKFHQNPLKTVGGAVEARLCLRMDGRMDGWTDKPKTIIPFDLHWGTINNPTSLYILLFQQFYADSQKLFTCNYENKREREKVKYL